MNYTDMATLNLQDWTPGFDEFGNVCRYDKVTNAEVHPRIPTKTPAGLSTRHGVDPNMPTTAPFIPASIVVQQAVAEAWKEYETDEDDKRTYWHNEILNESTWERPMAIAPRKPPPPPSPPSAPKERYSPDASGGGGKENIKEKKKQKQEKDQWKQHHNSTGRKYWKNEETAEVRFEIPACLTKYG